MTSQGVTGEGERPARRRRVEALLFAAQAKALDYARLLSHALRAIRCANVRSGILPPQSRLRGNDEPRRDGRSVSDPLAASKWKLMLREIETKALDYAPTPVARPSGHSLRECSLRHPASAVPPSREMTSHGVTGEGGATRSQQANGSLGL